MLQAHGAEIYFNKKRLPIGQFGDINTWSFCQDKIISTGGEGGMVTTNNEDYFNKMWSFKDHGKSMHKILNTHNSLKYNYIHDNLGSNFRLTEMQSAIGIIQLKKLKTWREIRSTNAQIIINTLKDINLIRVPLPLRGNYSCMVQI